MELDPVVVCAARYSVALLFAFSCWSKLRSFGVFKATLADYEIVPATLLSSASMLVVAMEFAIAIAGFIEPLAVWAMYGAMVLLFVYAFAIGINLLRGRRDIDCGCTGPAVKQLLSSWLLVRNGSLICLAIVGAQAPYIRALSWVDYVLLVVVIAVGSLVYGALNQLLSNGPRLDALDALMDTN